MLILVAACSTPTEQTVTSASVSSSTTTTAATSGIPRPSTTTRTTAALDRGDLEGWELVAVAVDQTELLVALADDPAERSQGLMGVEDLGSVDGMLFVFPSDTAGAFWMKDTLIALDIAFFAADGRLIEVMTMEPCVSNPCPLYRPGESYRWALETMAGNFRDLSDTARLTFP